MIEIDDSLTAILEGMLFLAGDEGLSVRELAVMTDLEEHQIALLLENYRRRLEEDASRGLCLVYLANRYKLATKVQYREYFEKMAAQPERGLSQAALETLAIIAYKQPVTRLEIEEIRGVASDAMVRRLQARALIKEVGRAETPGKPILYGVTDTFMDAFNLADLNELPPLQETKAPSDEPMSLFDRGMEEDHHE